nr:DNA topoisomerase 3-alpha-like [Quercus suber]POE99625.1 hypothetical protein CFP56_49352 [Quercus suber]
METQGTSLQEPPRVETVGGSSGTSDVICKCGEGWTCVITRTEGPDAGKAFFKCGENCTCVIWDSSGDSNVKQKLENFSGGAFCKCGEGWSCVISKIEGPKAGKDFFECADGCTCTTE